MPKRAENLLAALAALTSVKSLDALRVVEAGCGFGALAAYLALSAQPASLHAVDLRPDYVAAARASAAPLGLSGRLEFREDDMRSFESVEDASVDLVILNNAFIYLPTRSDMQQGISALARVLAPNGHALFFQANRWTVREPFTKDPVLHLLPAGLARQLARATGWKHNHGRVRLLSPPGLKSMLVRRGFESVGYGAFGPRGFVRGRAAWGAGFFALAGRRSDRARLPSAR